MQDELLTHDFAHLDKLFVCSENRIPFCNFAFLLLILNNASFLQDERNILVMAASPQNNKSSMSKTLTVNLMQLLRILHRLFPARQQAPFRVILCFIFLTTHYIRRVLGQSSPESVHAKNLVETPSPVALFLLRLAA